MFNYTDDTNSTQAYATRGETLLFSPNTNLTILAIFTLILFIKFILTLIYFRSNDKKKQIKHLAQLEALITHMVNMDFTDQAPQNKPCKRALLETRSTPPSGKHAAPSQATSLV